jgi:transposase InsO family protein
MEQSARSGQTAGPHARVFCDRFFGWYAHEHRHSGIGLDTPADVHYGRAHATARPPAGS